MKLTVRMDQAVIILNALSAEVKLLQEANERLLRKVASIEKRCVELSRESTVLRNNQRGKEKTTGGATIINHSALREW